MKYQICLTNYSMECDEDLLTWQETQKQINYE